MSKRRSFLKLASFSSGLVLLPSGISSSIDFEFEVLLESFLMSWKRSARYTLDIADAMHNEFYHFRPSAEVRSFAEQILHIASSVYGYSNLISSNPKTPDSSQFLAEGKSKVEIVSVLDSAFQYAHRVVKKLNESRAMTAVPWGGRGYEDISEMSLLNVVRIMHDHTAHHRGQCIVYLRLKNIVPPTYID